MTHQTELVIDDELALELLMDMELYTVVPRLQPLRAAVMEVHSRVTRLQEAGPVADDTVREWYKELAKNFFQLVSMLIVAGHTESLGQLRALLKARHRLDVETLIVPCTGAGLVRL